MARQNWDRIEALSVFNLYCRTTFGRLHSRNPDVIFLAERLGRTPSAVAMKLVNFASLDPIQQARGIHGLGNASKMDREIFEYFREYPEQLAIESEQAFANVTSTEPSADVIKPSELVPNDIVLPIGATETMAVVRIRLVQRFFRNTVLSSYDYECALCGLKVPELLNASHIVPWNISSERRVDPTNGLSLCALHDRAFDRGLLTFDSSLRAIVSERLMNDSTHAVMQSCFIDLSGCELSSPSRFAPDHEAIRYHREHIYQG